MAARVPPARVLSTAPGRGAARGRQPTINHSQPMPHCAARARPPQSPPPAPRHAPRGWNRLQRTQSKIHRPPPTDYRQATAARCCTIPFVQHRLLPARPPPTARPQPGGRQPRHADRARCLPNRRSADSPPAACSSISQRRFDRQAALTDSDPDWIYPISISIRSS